MLILVWFFWVFCSFYLNGNLDSPLSMLGKLGFIAGILILIDFFVDLVDLCQVYGNTVVDAATAEIISNVENAMIGELVTGVIVVVIAIPALVASAAKKEELENELMEPEKTEHVDWF